eukprot:TRINITY_DN55017_c0_g1_i8.p1 TRINITY_DN55017_c0_g1~~TRINITY_DN55017_c0_g1_i8.p1  ORF type:complete len:509 (+),score=110.03 TRINITY_DN55017_c0_g1_i8:169-1527(+)
MTEKLLAHAEGFEDVIIGLENFTSGKINVETFLRNCFTSFWISSFSNEKLADLRKRHVEELEKNMKMGPILIRRGLAEAHQELFTTILPDLSVKYERGKLKQKALGLFTRKTKVISRLTPKTVVEVNDLLLDLKIPVPLNSSSSNVFTGSSTTTTNAESREQKDTREDSEEDLQKRLSQHSSNGDFLKINVYIDDMTHFLGVIEIRPEQTASVFAEIVLSQFESELLGFLFEIVDEEGKRIGSATPASDMPSAVWLKLHPAQQITKSGQLEPLSRSGRLNKQKELITQFAEDKSSDQKHAGQMDSSHSAIISSPVRSALSPVVSPLHSPQSENNQHVVDPKFVSRYRTFSMQMESKKTLQNHCAAFDQCVHFPAEANEEQSTFGMPILPSQQKHHAFGRNWHTECFVCSKCGTNLVGKKVFLENDQLYCVSDYMAKSSKDLSPKLLDRTTKF